MYTETRNRILNGVQPGVEAFALLESAVLHLRNLVDFFYPGKVRNDDVIAMDYAANWDCQRPPLTPALRDARERAHKELAHLTTQRKAGSAPAKEWDFANITAELKPVLEAFLRVADSATLSREASVELDTVGTSLPGLS